MNYSQRCIFKRADKRTLIERLRSYAVAMSVAFGAILFAPHFVAMAQAEQFAQSEETQEGKDAPELPKSDPKTDEPTETEEKEEVTSGSAEGFDNQEYPVVVRDLSKLPFPVRRMRELILEAARSGDLEKMRPLIGYGDDLTMLSLGGIDEDPINFLRSLSGDEKGHEILAILMEVLESGYVHMDAGTEQELYVWPYFFAWPLDRLSDAQRVELYRIVTHGDYEDMKSFGAYIFYRVGITPRGRWRFFVAGD